MIINEDLAKLAHEMNSMYDYKPGSATAEYNSLVARARHLAEWQKGRVDPRYHDKINYLLGLYERKLAETLNKRNRIEMQCPSMLIAGPVISAYKKDKQNAARDKNNREYMDVQGILDKIRGTGMGGISGDDPDAAEKIRQKIEARRTWCGALKKSKEIF